MRGTDPAFPRSPDRGGSNRPRRAKANPARSHVLGACTAAYGDCQTALIFVTYIQNPMRVLAKQVAVVTGGGRGIGRATGGEGKVRGDVLGSPREGNGLDQTPVDPEPRQPGS